LKGAQKVIIDPQVRNVVPYLPLPDLKQPKQVPPPAASQGGTR
jgi:hypothetical protein